MLRPAVLTILACAPLAAADDFSAHRIDDLRLALGAASNPAVEERVDGGPGPEVGYAWLDNRIAGFTTRLGLQARLLRLGGMGSLVAGAGARYSYWETTPDGYGLGGGGVAPNPSSNPSLTFQTLQGEIAVGYATRVIRAPFGGWWHAEATLYAGFGPAWGQTQDFTPGAGIQSGSGWALAWGPRLGGYLCTAPWVFGVELEARLGDAEIEARLEDGRTSTLTYDLDGWAASAVVGYRF